MWLVLGFVMCCVCRMCLCRGSRFPWDVGTVVGGGVVLCAKPMVLGWCSCAVELAVHRAQRVLVVLVCVLYFAELLEWSGARTTLRSSIGSRVFRVWCTPPLFPSLLLALYVFCVLG